MFRKRLAVSFNQVMMQISLAISGFCLSTACFSASSPTTSVTSVSDSTLQVLHWWTSTSERKAAAVLAAKSAEEGIIWRDAAIPGGAGIAAGKVLKSRVLARNAPEVTQIIGASLQEWADFGFLLELDKVAANQRWDSALFPTVFALIQHKRHIVATPLGIHRSNVMFYNKKLFASLKLNVPKTWEEWQIVAQRFKAIGMPPIAQGREPWQIAGLFENLILAEGGSDFYKQVFVRLSSDSIADKRFANALEHLRIMKSWMVPHHDEKSWSEVARQFSKKEAAMFIMGDWAKSELIDYGMQLDDDFGCATVPGTNKLHLYSVDTLAMFTNDYSHKASQEKFARIVAQPNVQYEYNAIKGSIPVRRDIDPTRLDSCALSSWQTFSLGSQVQAPSAVHRMAIDETKRDAIIAVIHKFFIDDKQSVQETQARLIGLYKTFSSANKPRSK